ncbi:aurora kinase A- and ninein-interacting protein [Leptosomus discolor]
MKRRGGAARQAEACDVWLDTAELKRRAAQPVIAKLKVSSRILERTHVSVAFTQTRAYQPRTKQTTISSFFSTQTDEKDKENSRPPPFTPNKDCKGKGISLPACPVKILALPQMEEAQNQPFRAEEMVQVTPRRRARKAPASPAPLPGSGLLEAESRSGREASCGAGENCCCLDFTQDSEGNRVIAHRKKSDVFAGDRVSASGSVTPACRLKERAGQLLPEEAEPGLDSPPRLGANRNKKPRLLSSVNSLTDFSENINPTRRRDSTCAAGVSSSPQSPARARPLAERSQNAGAGPAAEGRGSEAGLGSPRRQLFTQDSEGNRVMAHRCQTLPSARRQLPSSAYRGCSSDAVNRSLGKRGEEWADMSYHLLFTQDSEGNRDPRSPNLTFFRLSSGTTPSSCPEGVGGSGTFCCFEDSGYASQYWLNCVWQMPRLANSSVPSARGNTSLFSRF